MAWPDADGGRAGLGSLAGRLELGLDDGRLPDGHGVGRGDSVAGRQLGWHRWSFKWRR